MASVLEILNVFYKKGVEFLPVLDSTSGELRGILSRSHLTAVASDLERAGSPFATIPQELFDATDAAEAASFLSQQKSVHLILDDGTGDITREPASVLALLGVQQRKKATAAPKETLGGNDPAGEVKLWLSRILLSTIPFPLFAIDLKGKTLFYNGGFENGILSSSQLNRSIGKAEKLFLDLSRETLANAAARGMTPDEMSGVTPMGESFRMANLQDGGKIVGYLFAFESSNVTSEQFTARIRAGAGFDAVMDRLEKSILLSLLADSDYNISRTADVMKTKRTTLQSRMKRLKIPLKARSAASKPVSAKPKKQSKKVNRKPRKTNKPKQRTKKSNRSK
ncbi:MAG: hypothetical protein JNM27_17955 [Leptospirales bacterium]|nr:hypothetical protein [Leptospirales bacterium]